MTSFESWLLKPEEAGSVPSILWNALGSGLFAGQAAIVLVFVARVEELAVAGVISLAYAVANLFFSLARFGMRNFQVTDVKQAFPFDAYRRSRVVTVSASLVLGTVYAFGQWCFGSYDASKAMLLVEIVLLKLVDSVDDLFVARYQQAGHFATGAKMTAVRQSIVTSVICAIITLGFGPHVAFGCGVGVSSLLVFVLTSRTWGVAGSPDHRLAAYGDVWRLLTQCLPLCVGTTLSIFVGNMPKYAIDAFLDEGTQAVFGYIMLPVFVITLLNQFMYQPFVKTLGDFWVQGDVVSFRRRVMRHCAAVVALALLTLVGGALVGLPMLSALYSVDLTGYRVEFMVLMVGGVLYTLASYLSVPLTTIRAQRIVAGGYILALAISLSLQAIVVPSQGLMGAAVLYLAQNGVLLGAFAIALIVMISNTDAVRDGYSERMPRR